MNLSSTYILLLSIFNHEQPVFISAIINKVEMFYVIDNKHNNFVDYFFKIYYILSQKFFYKKTKKK